MIKSILEPNLGDSSNFTIMIIAAIFSLFSWVGGWGGGGN